MKRRPGPAHRERAACAFAVLACAGAPALAADTNGSDDAWRIDGQFTNVTQKHPPFRAPYSGPNSLPPRERMQETSDATLYAGHRFGPATELWINGEVDQGFGLGNTLGVAGFPSGEAYKVGANAPYLRLPRAFVRHTISLGGQAEDVEAATNQFAAARSKDNVVVTVGKFSVVDIFDANSYAHDPRGDFLNWSIIDAGAFDYAADPWGYTFGAAAEWNHGPWTLRGGVFQMSAEPNGKVAGFHFGRHMLVAEAERRTEWAGHPGKIRLLAFTDHAPMGSYRDAVQLAAATGGAPDTANVRHTQSKPGIALNVEQEISRDAGAFLRISANDGRKEAYEFSEINRSVSGGIAWKGSAWGRADDVVGVAAAVNALSGDARSYFAAGGMGILIGDGALRYSTERIAEVYYSAALSRKVSVAVDFQRIVHPAYNADRGPVSVFGARLHCEF